MQEKHLLDKVKTEETNISYLVIFYPTCVTDNVSKMNTRNKRLLDNREALNYH